MSDHVLLNLLNVLRKAVKCEDFLTVFGNNLNKFNNKRTNVRFYLSVRTGCICVAMQMT